MRIVGKRTRFSHNIRWQLVANGTQVLLGGGYLVLLGRWLGPDGFGVYSAVMALVSVAGLVLEMRLQEVVARNFCSFNDEVKNRDASLSLLVDLLLLEVFSRLLTGAALILFSVPLANFIKLDKDPVEMLAIAACGFVISKSGNSVSNGLLRVTGRTDLIASCMLVDWGMRIALATTLVMVCYLDVPMALWVGVVGGGTSNLVQLLFARREVEKRLTAISSVNWQLSAALVRLKSNFRLILSNLGVSVSDLMAKDLDVVLISNHLTADKVGVYKLAKSFVQVTWRAIDPFFIAILPEIQKLFITGELQKILILLKKTSIGLFVYAIVLVLSSTLLIGIGESRLLGVGYQGVATLMGTMSLWVVVCAPQIWGHALAIAINRPEYNVIGNSIGMLCGLVAFNALVPEYGLTGAAVAWNITLIIGISVVTTGAIYNFRALGKNEI